MTSLLLLSPLVVLSLAVPPAIHEKPITIRVKNGGPLTIKVPALTKYWYRKFKDGREMQFLEACDEYLDVCELWISGYSDQVQPPKVFLDVDDGSIYMPKVSYTDSAQYYTHYFTHEYVVHYAYFDVIVE